jgi:hypothetical protein
MTFADVGGLWQTANEKVSVALKAGAASAALVDITPLDSPPWQHLHDRMSSLGVSTYRNLMSSTAAAYFIILRTHRS